MVVLIFFCFCGPDKVMCLAIYIVDLCGSLLFANLRSLYTIVDLVDNLDFTQEQK